MLLFTASLKHQKQWNQEEGVVYGPLKKKKTKCCSVQISTNLNVHIAIASKSFCSVNFQNNGGGTVSKLKEGGEGNKPGNKNLNHIAHLQQNLTDMSKQQ